MVVRRPRPLRVLVAGGVVVLEAGGGRYRMTAGQASDLAAELARAAAAVAVAGVREVSVGELLDAVVAGHRKKKRRR